MAPKRNTRRNPTYELLTFAAALLSDQPRCDDGVNSYLNPFSNFEFGARQRCTSTCFSLEWRKKCASLHNSANNSNTNLNQQSIVGVPTSCYAFVAQDWSYVFYYLCTFEVSLDAIITFSRLVDNEKGGLMLLIKRQLWSSWETSTDEN